MKESCGDFTGDFTDFDIFHGPIVHRSKEYRVSYQVIPSEKHEKGGYYVGHRGDKSSPGFHKEIAANAPSIPFVRNKSVIWGELKYVK